jgi:hypothetical protein
VDDCVSRVLEEHGNHRSAFVVDAEAVGCARFLGRLSMGLHIQGGMRRMNGSMY